MSGQYYMLLESQMSCTSNEFDELMSAREAPHFKMSKVIHKETTINIKRVQTLKFNDKTAK